MRIDRITIKNFKGFEERVFDFPRSIDTPLGNGSFHLIIGKNGKGKTSALDALAVAAGSWLLGVRGEDSRHIQPEDVRIRIHDFEDTQRIERQLPVVVEAEGLVLGESLTWKRQLNDKKTDWVNAKNVKSAAAAAVEAAQKGGKVTLPLISYYGTGRLWQEPKDMKASGEAEPRKANAPQDANTKDDDLAESFNSRLAGYRYSIDPRCSPKELLRWLKFEQEIAGAEKKDSRQFRVVKKAIQSSVEGCRRVDYHPRLGLLLDIEGQPRLPFGALSDGQRNMLAMVGDMAFKVAQLNPHLGEEVLKYTPGIVLIDELDLHLHPTWQRQVIDTLRQMFPAIQFICTSHSPFLIQALKPGELVWLVPPEDEEPDYAGMPIEDILEDVQGVSVPQRGHRAEILSKATERYFSLIQQNGGAKTEELAEAEKTYREVSEAYSTEPGLSAILKLRAMAAAETAKQ
jgi:predicted ATP-binding protein involved in virulence